MNASLSRTILLVEDDFLTAMMERKQLEREDYTVLHAATGEKALELILGQTTVVDMVLMDIDLGAGIDGTEAAQRILEVLDIPVVFLSSHTEKEIVQKTEQITSYGYVVKSSSFTVLDASIKMAFKLFESKKCTSVPLSTISAGSASTGCFSTPRAFHAIVSTSR